MIASALRNVGRNTVNFLADTGATWRLTVAALSRFLTGPFRPEHLHIRATVEQSVRAGYSSLPLVALRNGARLIEVNPNETLLSTHAHEVLRGPAAEVLPGWWEIHRLVDN